jgi:uncharacterized membrane protein
MPEHTTRSRPLTAALVAATVASGLAAGVFYAFSVGVMAGLKHSSDRTFVEAMQDMNTYIVNGWFMLSFLGALALPALAAVLQYRSGAGRRTVLPWIIAGFVLYGITFLITGGVSIPLNDQLAEAGSPDRIHDLAAVRADFESKWIAWNVVRTLTSTAAFCCLGWALVRYGREGRAQALSPAQARAVPVQNWPTQAPMVQVPMAPAPVNPPATMTPSRSW